MLYGLPNRDLKIFEMVQNAAVRIAYSMPRFGTKKISPKVIDLHFLPIKAKIKFKKCLLAHKVLLSDEPKYSKKKILQTVPTSGLRISSSN